MDVKPLDLFGPGARFHHVGMVVKSIDAVAPPGLAKVHDPIQRVNVAFVDVHGERVEFIEPAGENSPVAGNLARQIKLAHLCYSVPSMDHAIAHAEALGLRQISQPAPAVAFDGKLIVWMFHPVFGLFELLECPSSSA